MKIKILFTLGVLALLMTVSLPIYSADQDFTLVNSTGVTINELHVSPATARDWQENVLGVDALEDGEEVEIAFSREEEENEEEEQCLWDIMVNDSKGNELYWENIDLCENDTITLHFEDGKAWATFE